MRHRPFEMFREMIESLPPQEVLEAAVMERRMLDDDLAKGQTVPSEDTALIRTLCRFLERAAHGRLVLPGTMPMEHWTFYGRTVERLVAAGKLPHKAKEDFEAANHKVLFCIMARPPDFLEPDLKPGTPLQVATDQTCVG